MIRIFNVYYPARMLVLVAGESLLVCASFLLAVLVRLGSDSLPMLESQYGFYKILGVTLVALLSMDLFDLYDPQRVPTREETYMRLLVVLGSLSFMLAGVTYLFPDFLLGNNTSVLALLILTITLFGWRSSYAWLVRQPYLRERVYVLGTGERAQTLVESLRARPEFGIDVVGWSAGLGSRLLTREVLATRLKELVRRHEVDRIIVAFGDRRGTMPVRELLELRLRGIRVEDATGILEKIGGKIDVTGLYPSWLIFSEGFRISPAALLVRRILSIIFSLACLLLLTPLLPLIALAIKLTSPGPLLYRQRRVGRNGRVFVCYKFRTMRCDAEATTGPTWAGDDDPRITGVGRWLRSMRLDEIPQLWNVLRGDMGFVGPRPERPEFVEWLSHEIPYYHLRHIIPPGITGWAQVRYQYAGSLEDSKEKLKYDLYYIKYVGLPLDLLIILQTVKIVLLGRGSR